MTLESLDGVFGACDTSKIDTTQLISGPELQSKGLQSVSEILLTEGYKDYKKTANGYQVKTKNGLVSLPTIVNLGDKQKVIDKLKGIVPASNNAGIVPTVDNGSSNANTSAMKKVGGVLLGLAVVVGIIAIAKSETAKPKVLSGIEEKITTEVKKHVKAKATVKKKKGLRTLHI